MKTNLIIAAVAALFLPVSAFAGSVTLLGDTTTAPTFNRPTETGATSAFTVHYNAYQINITQSGSYTFTLNATDPSSYDTFLHIFVNAFNPVSLYDVNDQAINFLAANDDASPSTTNSAITATLDATKSYFFVADGFSGSDAGAYTASVTGPGSIMATVVPEPSSAVLMGLAGTGLLLFGLKRCHALRR